MVAVLRVVAEDVVFEKAAVEELMVLELVMDEVVEFFSDVLKIEDVVAFADDVELLDRVAVLLNEGLTTGDDTLLLTVVVPA